MNNNRLCAGLALLLCLIAVPVCVQAGSSGATPVQTTSGQAFSLGRGAAVTLGVVAAGLGVYGLYQWYKRWSNNSVNRPNQEQAEQSSQDSGPIESEYPQQMNPAMDSYSSEPVANAASVYVAGPYSTAEGARLLREAARSGDVATVRRLLGEGASVDAVDSIGWTVLHQAARGGHAAVAELLLAAGARIDATNGSMQTPLHIAGSNSHDAIVQRLLAAGAAVDAADSHGWTSLLVAASRGCDVNVRCLLAAGARAGVATNNGQTALHEAAWACADASVCALLDAGADPDATNWCGEAPLHKAAVVGHGSTARQLLGAGADLNARDRNGNTALHVAAMWGHGATTRLLIVRGAAPLTLAECERIISRSYAGDWQRVRENLKRLQPLTEQASLERKQAIESTLEEIEIDAEWLPRELQKLIIAMSEHPDVITWWRQTDRLRAVSDLRLPIEALERIVAFDSPQDSGAFQAMLE